MEIRTDNYILERDDTGDIVRAHAFVGHAAMNRAYSQIPDPEASRLEKGVHLDEKDFNALPEIVVYVPERGSFAVRRLIEWHEAALHEWREMQFIEHSEWMERKGRLESALSMLYRERDSIGAAKEILVKPSDMEVETCHGTRTCAAYLLQHPDQYPEAQ